MILHLSRFRYSMLKNYYFPIFIYFLLLNTSHANISRQHQVDSLKMSLKGITGDTNKANIWVQIALLELESDSALEYMKKALAIEKQYNNKARLGYIYRKIGNIYYERFNNYGKGLAYYFTSLKLFQEINDTDGMAWCFNNIGNVYFTKAKFSRNKSDYDLALVNHFKALKLREALGEKGGIVISNSFLNLGEIYLEWQQYKDAVEYYHKASELFMKTADTSAHYTTNVIGSVLISFMGLAKAYSGLGDYYSSQKYITWCQKHFEIGEYPKGEMEVDMIFGQINPDLGPEPGLGCFERVLCTLHYTVIGYESLAHHH